jgi:CO/xanthine dehydrogenase Mo-binding subunit
MEGRGIVAEPDPTIGRIRVHGATKVPHWNLEATAKLLQLDPGSLLFQETAVGGGFGIRGELYPEDVLAVWVARRLERPVTWIEDRREHLVAANHSREQHHRAAIAGSSDGRILAIESEFWVDVGAYVRTHGIRVPDLTLSMLPGPYELEAYRGRAHCVVSNKTPAGTYRAPGRYESSFVRERLIDLFARQIGRDPVEVRRLNLIPPSRLPYRRPLASTGEPMLFGEGDYPALLEKVVAAAPIDEVERRRAAGELVGWGIAFFLEKSGLGPWEEGSVAVEPDGTIRVLSGGTSVGQGYRTVMAQIVADRLQVPVDRVTVELLDTDRVPAGIGSYASRTTVTAGSALVRASDEVIDLARRVVADAMELASEDLVLTDGGLEVAGAPDFRWTLGEIAEMLTPERAARLDLPARLGARARFDVERVVYPYGAVWAEAGADPETGRIRLERLVIGYDIGRAVNPTLVEGQMQGGAAQAVGGALYEVFRYDPEGNPVSTSFADYLIPTLAEVPPVTAVISEDHPTSTNPLGVKGAGEAGVPGVAAAIAAAVEQAVGKWGWVLDLPIHPAQVRLALTGLTGRSRS